MQINKKCLYESLINDGIHFMKFLNIHMKIITFGPCL